VLGTHSLKFGGDFRDQKFDQFLYYDINGYFTIQGSGALNSVSSSDAYPNYFLGVPYSYSQARRKRRT